VKALSAISHDDIGKEAIRDALKKIVITPAQAEAASFTFEDGTITWKAYFGSSSAGYVYADAMQAKLEKAL
jgi:hypothetical protein